MSVPNDVLAATIEALPAEVAVLDDRGEILYTNEQWRRFGRENGLGTDAATVGVNYLRVTEAADDDRYASAAAAGIRAVAEGDRQEFTFEYPCHSPDEKRWFMMSAKAVDVDGSRYVFVGHVNITERRLAEERVREKNRQLQTVADVLSHDLRNPLGVAAGYVDRLSTVPGVDAETVNRIESALERAQQIVSDAVVLARETTVEETILVDLERAATDAWAHVDTDEATLSVAESLHFDADESLLLTLLENLFRNSVEHGGSSVTVEVGPLPGEDGFHVQDTGPGVPPKLRDGIFEAGTTGGDGTGLGLAIVRSVVDAHGWEITVEERTTGGARFEIVGLSVR